MSGEHHHEFTLDDGLVLKVDLYDGNPAGGQRVISGGFVIDGYAWSFEFRHVDDAIREFYGSPFTLTTGPIQPQKIPVLADA